MSLKCYKRLHLPFSLTVIDMKVLVNAKRSVQERLFTGFHYGFFYSIFFLSFLIGPDSSSALAQEIKKSKKIETIVGHKFYLHTVEKGQTLYSISKAYEMDVNAIIKENPEIADGLKINHVLRIPFETEAVAEKTSEKYYMHKIEQGQTPYSISKYYSITLEKLNALNPELKDGMKIGQLIRIPLERIEKPKQTLQKELKETKALTEINPSASGHPIPASSGAVTEIPLISKPIVIRDSTVNRPMNVALFLPFRLGDTSQVSGDQPFPVKTSIALEFYEGAMMAVDSIKKQGFSGKVYVYDVDDKDSARVPALLKKPEMASMDLIIGPLYTSSFVPVAKFAKDKKISIVSPLSQQNKVLLNNPYVSKTIPSSITQLEQTADYIAKKYSGENILVVNTSNAKETALLQSFNSRAQSAVLKNNPASKDTIKEAIGISGVEGRLATDRVNVIVLPSNNQAYVTDFITSLSVFTEKYNIILFGMQNWINFENLDLEYLNKLQLHLPSHSFVDYDNWQTKQFIKKYREVYKAEPSEFVYQAFDVTYYFMENLKKYGLGFQRQLPSLKKSGLQTAFSFVQTSTDSGFENTSVYILKYDSYKFIRVN